MSKFKDLPKETLVALLDETVQTLLRLVQYMRCYVNADGLVCSSEGDEAFAKAMRLLSRLGYIDIYYNKDVYVFGELHLPTIEEAKSRFPVCPDIMIWKAGSLTKADFDYIYKRTGLDSDDVDYVALIKKSLQTPTFMDAGSSFGCCDVKRWSWDPEYDIVIGYHS